MRYGMLFDGNAWEAIDAVRRVGRWHQGADPERDHSQADSGAHSSVDILPIADFSYGLSWNSKSDQR
jgi:hypothetical protein